MFDYIYENEIDDYRYYLVPRALFENAEFSELSALAKVLYGIMLSKTADAFENGCCDDEDKVFITYFCEEIASDLGCDLETSIGLVKELDSFGLIDYVASPYRIYVRHFNR